MTKRTVRLTESELKRVINESVKKVLKENINQPFPSLLEILEDIVGNRASHEDRNDYEIQGKSGKYYRIMPYRNESVTIMWAPQPYDWDNGGEEVFPYDKPFASCIANYAYNTTRY